LTDISLNQAMNYDPELKIFMARHKVDSFENFIPILYADIDDIIEDMQRHRTMHPTTKTEDQLTEHILAQLRCKQYSAERDSDIGGHGDMCVQKNGFLWIGEAKIHKDYQYLGDGFHQLCTRYSCPTNKTNHGGLIIYIYAQKGQEVIKEWMKRLKSRGLVGFEEYGDISVTTCTINPAINISHHLHSATDYPYYVRHIPIFLSHVPKDKSARTRKS
jgi:hypothetical protein